MDSENIYIVEIETHFERFDDQRRTALKDLYGATSNSPQSLAKALYLGPEILHQALTDQLSPQGWELASELALEHGVDVDTGWATKEARDALKKMGFISPDARPGEANLPGIFAAIIAKELQHPPTTLVTLLGSEEDTRIKTLAAAYGVGNESAMLSLLNLSEFFSTVEGAEAIAAKLGSFEFLGAAFMIIELGGICFWREIFGSDLDEKSDDKVVGFASAEEKMFERAMTETLMDSGVIFRVENEPMALVVVPEELWNGLWSLGNEWIQEWTRTSFHDLHAHLVQSQTPSLRLDFQSTIKWVALELLKDPNVDFSALDKKVPEGLGRDLSKYLDLAEKVGAFTNKNTRILNEAFLPTLELSPELFSAEILNEWVCGFIEISGKEGVSFSTMMGLDESWRVFAHQFLIEIDDFVPPWILESGVASIETGHGYLRDGEHGDEEIQLEVTIVSRIFQRSKLLLLDLMSLMKRDTWYSITSLSDVFQMCCSASIFSHLSVVLNDPSLRLYIPLYRASFVGGELESGRAFEDYIYVLLNDLFAPLGIADVASSSFRLRSHPLTISNLVFSEEERRQTIEEIFEGEFEFSLESSPSKPSFFQVLEGLSITKSLRDLVDASEGQAICSFDGRFVNLEK